MAYVINQYRGFRWVDPSENYELQPGEYLSDTPPDATTPTETQLWSAYQRQAAALLVANDTVAIRCVKASVQYPAEWLACDVALRAIVHSTSGNASLPLPAQPITRPSGT